MVSPPGPVAHVVAQRVVERFVRSFQTGVTALEESEHVGRDQGVGEALEGAFVFDVSQVEGAGGVQVDDAGIVRSGANAAALYGIFEGHESHGSE